MKIISLTERIEKDIAKLTDVWRASVVATHTFLSADEIAQIEPFVPTALKNVQHLVTAIDDNDLFIAFMGVENNRLEMLFVAPQYIGQGIGSKLIEYGIEKYQINEVTVNEQNPKAVGFYEHLGFKTYKRTATDEQERPYPLLYMKR